MEQNNVNPPAETPEQTVENDLFTLTGSEIQPVTPHSAAAEPAQAEPPAIQTVAQTIVPEPLAPSLLRKEEPADPAEPEPVPRKAPAPRITLRSGSGASLGTLLTEARNAAAMSLEQAVAATHIRTDYIQALEQDETEKLPNLVFLRAYVRALIQLYNLDTNSIALIKDQLQELEPPKDVPEKVLEDIGKDVQVSEEEVKRIRTILIYGGIILALLISLTITCFVAVGIRNSRQQQTAPQVLRPFDSSKLEQLLPPQLPEPQILKVPAPAQSN